MAQCTRSPCDMMDTCWSLRHTTAHLVPRKCPDFDKKGNGNSKGNVPPPNRKKKKRRIQIVGDEESQEEEDDAAVKRSFARCKWGHK